MNSLNRSFVSLSALFYDWKWLSAYLPVDDSHSSQTLSKLLSEIFSPIDVSVKNELLLHVEEANLLAYGISTDKALPNLNFIEPTTRTPLSTSFSNLNEARKRKYYKPMNFGIETDYLPVSIEDYQTWIQSSAHKDAWSSLITEFQTKALSILRDFKIETASVDILNALQHQFSNLPSLYLSGMESPDLSIFTLAKIRAGLASSLYEKALSDTNDKVLNKNDFLLLGGALSGIQNFIYDTPTKGAGKSLKARSFYLQMLVEAVLAEIQQRLHLDLTHTIYSSGGGFYIVCSNLATKKEGLIELSHEIESYFYSKFNGKLSISLEWTEMSKNNLAANSDPNSQTLKDVWMGLSQKLSDKKKRKFLHLISNQQDFFEPKDGRPQKRQSQLFDNELIELGKFLNKTSGLELKNSNGKDVDLEADSNSVELLATSSGTWTLKLVGRANISRPIDSLLMTVFVDGDSSESIYLLGGNFVPEEKGIPIDYSKLADMSVGVKRLGVLRMDVDNLGWLFGNGFSLEKHSLARLSALSYSLDYFFRGYINSIFNERLNTHVLKLKEKEKPNESQGNQEATKEKIRFRDKCILLYSGGDDLFCLGSWDAVWVLASLLRSKFYEFVGEHPSVTLSGGLVLVKGTYPIAAAARLSNEEENNAKTKIFSFNGEDNAKNSISIFNTPLNWDFEFPIINALYEDLALFVGSSGIGPNLLTNIFGWYSMATSVESSPKQKLAWRWLSAYQMSRIARILNDGQTIRFKEWILDLQRTMYEGGEYRRISGESIVIHEGSYSFLTYLSLSARLTELTLK